MMTESRVTFREQLQLWRARAAERIKRRWWLYVLLAFAAGQLKDYFQGEINSYLAERTGIMVEFARAVFIALSPIGLAACVLAVILGGVVIFAYFDTRKPQSTKHQQASAVGASLPSSVNDPPAPVESVEQLCTFYHCCLAPALRWAIDFLDAGICGSAAAATGDRAMISLLIREQLLPPCREKLERLHDLIVAPVDWTESRFNEAIGNARTLLDGDYRRLAFWISGAGSEILGEPNLVAMAGHLELRYRHWELFTEARRIRAPHSRLAGIVPLLTDVERFFSGLARPASTTILQAMSVGELQAHAQSEGVAWFIGKRWGTGRLLIVDRQETGPQATLSLACKTEDGYAVILESLDQHNLEKLLWPGKHLAAVGTIKEIIGGRIVLSPVEVVHAESDS